MNVTEAESPPVLSVVTVFVALLVIFNSIAGWIYTYTIKTFPSPFPEQPLFGNRYISSHELGAIGVTVGMRPIGGADARRGISAQRHEALHTHFGEFTNHGIDLMAGSVNAGHVRGRRQRRLVEDALDGACRALARRTAGAVGDRYKCRRERLQATDRSPQRHLALLGFRR